LGEGADEAVDLFEAEDNMVLIGEITVILLMLLVSCDDCYLQGALTEKATSTRCNGHSNRL
jgi:hypothetical protein